MKKLITRHHITKDRGVYHKRINDFVTNTAGATPQIKPSIGKYLVKMTWMLVTGIL